MPSILANRSSFEVEQEPATVIQDLLRDRTDIVAVLDANRIGNLPEQLEVAGLEHICMFQGQLAEEAAHVAPWMVRLPREHEFLEQLFTSAGAERSDPFAYLEAEAGIYFETEMSLSELRRHLRRFMRVLAHDGKPFLFRFWEPSIAGVYFEGLNGRDELIQRWFTAREGGRISRICVPLPAVDTVEMVHLTAQGLPEDVQGAEGAFKLTNRDIDRFQQVRVTRDLDKIAIQLTEVFPDAVKHMSEAEISAFTHDTVARMGQFGFVQKPILFTLLAWELHYGPDFEARDRQGQLAQIMNGNDTEEMRFNMLKARMAALG